MATFLEKLEHAWNAFRGEPRLPPATMGPQFSYGRRPDRRVFSRYNDRSLITPIISQIVIDCSEVELRHVRVGDDDEYLRDIDSGLNECLTTNPNLDQGPAHFRRDIVSTMLNSEDGIAAIVPVQTSLNPNKTGSYDIHQLRVGTIKQWMPQHVRVDLYNERLGIHQEVVMDKSAVAIVENPHYDVMNAPNSTLKRLRHKLGQLDITDDRLASGKLDIILQMPYTTRTDRRQEEALRSIRRIEEQVEGNRLGIGYVDTNERITQLNRPSENNLLDQVKNLEERLYAQMGLTPEIFFGTADEAAMLNYQNRTVVPIVSAIQEEMNRKFLTKTARTQKQAIKYFRSPFSLVPVGQIAEIADKFTRNEIMSPNEFRSIVGLRPVDDPEANELRNRNMPKVIDEKPEEGARDVETPPENEEREETDEA